jgi:hypothetical protein
VPSRLFFFPSVDFLSCRQYLVHHCTRSAHLKRLDAVKAVGFSLALLLTLASCSEKRPEPARPQEVRFFVDSALVTPSVADTVLGISFSPPKGWQPLSQRLLLKAEGTVAQTIGDTSTVNPQEAPHILSAWRDPGSGSVLLVSRFPGFDTADSSSTLREYEQYYAHAVPSADVRGTLFSSSGFKVHQLLVSDSQKVIFKMVFSSNGLKSPIQFDFVVPQVAYPQFIKTIESVAGSVTIHSPIKPTH